MKAIDHKRVEQVNMCALAHENDVSTNLIPFLMYRRKLCIELIECHNTDRRNQLESDLDYINCKIKDYLCLQ